MYALVTSVPLRDLVREQIPAIAASILIAEMFYKFHSFTLECIAFLATWAVIDAAISFGTGRRRSK